MDGHSRTFNITHTSEVFFKMSNVDENTTIIEILPENNCDVNEKVSEAKHDSMFTPEKHTSTPTSLKDNENPSMLPIDDKSFKSEIEPDQDQVSEFTQVYSAKPESPSSTGSIKSRKTRAKYYANQIDQLQSNRMLVKPRGIQLRPEELQYTLESEPSIIVTLTLAIQVYLF